MTRALHLRSWLLTALAALSPTVAAAGEDPPDPTRQELSAKLLASQAFAPAASVPSALRERLERQVAEFLSEPRWAPFHEWRGISTSGLSMTEPADAIQALALAYPYVKADQQRTILGYIDRDLKANKPWANVDCADLRGGAQRNFHMLDPQDFTAATPLAAPARRRPKLYPCWLLGHRTGRWDLIEPGYPQLRTIAEAIPEELPPLPPPDQRGDLKRMAELADAARDISSLIAFARIAHHFDKRGDAERSLDKLAGLLKQYLALHRQIGAECRQFLTAPASREGHPSAGGQFRNAGGPYVGRTHEGAIIYWTDLCPQLGELLREHAAGASADISHWMHRNAQGHYLVRGDTPVQEGEVFTPWYLTTMNYYNVQTKIMPADAGVQRLYLDAPACRADVHFLERLVRLIEARPAETERPSRDQ